jgi:hypothetical protein
MTSTTALRRITALCWFAIACLGVLATLAFATMIGRFSSLQSTITLGLTAAVIPFLAGYGIVRGNWLVAGAAAVYAFGAAVVLGSIGSSPLTAIIFGALSTVTAARLRREASVREG